MSSQPIAVTFVVPVFNKAAYLDECLRSIRSQSLQNTEIICIDDASTDESGEILETHRAEDGRVKIFEQTANAGAGASRNVGIEMAQGRYLRFVDADDLLPLDSAERMYKRAIENHADLVRGSLALFRGKDPDVHQSVIAVPECKSTAFRDESRLWIPWWHTSYLFSLDLLRTRGLRYPSLMQGEDPVFLASALVNAERISMIEDIVYLYRKYPKSTGSGQSSFESIGDLLEHARLVKSMFEGHFSDCWYSGYGPHLAEDVKTVLQRSKVSGAEMADLVSRARAVWSDFELGSSGRNKERPLAGYQKACRS